MMVASFGKGIQEPEPPEVAVAAAAAPAAVTARDLLRQRAAQEAGWESEEQRRQAPLPVRRPQQP